MCATRGVAGLHTFQPDSLPIAILGFLDDFAHPGGRYSNINKLTGHKHQAMAAPLVKWAEIASRIMNEQATPGQRKRAELNGQLASAAFGDAAASLISDMNQQQMDVARLFTRASELDSAARHAIYTLVTLIAALREVIDSLCDSARNASAAGRSDTPDVPDMKEFFQFAWADRQYVIRKRMWP